MLTENEHSRIRLGPRSWLKFMVEQCEEIERTSRQTLGLAFEGFCWYPFIDSTDWCSLVRQAKGNIDPQGIYWLETGTMRRKASELSDLYTALAKGQITSKDIPAYNFQARWMKLADLHAHDGTLGLADSRADSLGTQIRGDASRPRPVSTGSRRRPKGYAISDAWVE